MHNHNLEMQVPWRGREGTEGTEKWSIYHLEINVDLHIFTNLDKKVYMLLALKQNYFTKAKGVHKHSRAPLSL